MSDASDPYLYPGTYVLKNVPGLRNAEQCGAFETLNTAARIYELLQNPVHGGFDVASGAPPISIRVTKAASELHFVPRALANRASRGARSE